MLLELDHYFQEFIAGRTEEIGQALLMKNNCYRRLSDEREKVMEELRRILPASHQGLLFELEDRFNYRMAFANELMYRQGLTDGLQMRQVSVEQHVASDFAGDYV